jgi:hypothetical protein
LGDYAQRRYGTETIHIELAFVIHLRGRFGRVRFAIADERSTETAARFADHGRMLPRLRGPKGHPKKRD